MKIKTLIALLIVGSVPRMLQAKPSGADFLKISSPRAQALGQTDAVSSVGAQAAMGNPVNLYNIADKYEVVNVFQSLMNGQQYSLVSAAMSFKPSIIEESDVTTMRSSRGYGVRVAQVPHKPLGLDAVGMSLVRMGYGSIQGRRIDGTASGQTLGAQDLALGFTAAKKFKTSWQAGMTLRLLQSELASYKSDMAFDADFGFQRFGKKAVYYGSLQHLGNGVTFLEKTSPLPLTIAAGFTTKVRGDTAMVETRLRANEGKVTLAAGLEHPYGVMAWRVGYKLDSDGSKNLALKSQDSVNKLLGGFTAGFGVNIKRLTLDYAVSQPAAELGLAHAIAFTVRWGAWERDYY